MFDYKSIWEIFNYWLPASIVLLLIFLYTRSLLLGIATFVLVLFTIIVASAIYYVVRERRTMDAGSQ